MKTNYIMGDSFEIIMNPKHATHPLGLCVKRGNDGYVVPINFFNVLQMFEQLSACCIASVHNGVEAKKAPATNDADAAKVMQ